mmetsp:Transcript_169876/g.539604  ORF Transcript_169876/g.539604 Transcript_169876/m.539604 type:complete len:863 (+) Transcript_169876:176-2764(+)
MTMAAGYPALPALKEPPRHPLLSKCTFEQLHRNELIETKPHVLHFGGFQIHKEHSHVLRILNTSPSSLRVSIIGPSTQFFRISYDKKGLLAPGMSEDVTVTFMPHEWRYYYDTVKIFCGELAENLVVPIHAYPSASDIALPRLIDFGRGGIGGTKSKKIPLSCKIPISFEYDIAVIESHPDFDVTPLSGVIPPDGTAQVIITFAPSRHSTARMELQFNISQFDFEPVTVSVVGSSAPDITREEQLKAAEAEQAAVDAQGRHTRYSGKVASLGSKRGRGQIEHKPPSFPTEATERSVDGVKVSTTRFDPQATSFVLNQTAGKLPLKDLFSFIREQREGLQTLQKEQAAKAAAGEGAGGLTDLAAEADNEDKQALELRFEMHYREVEKYDRDKELRSLPAAGDEQPSGEDVDSILKAREQRHHDLVARRMLEDVRRVESVLGKSRTAVPSSYKPVIEPRWDKNDNDTFSVRLQVIDRFLRAGAKLLMQLRASRRAESLKRALRAAGVCDRASCRAWVEEETKAAAAGTKGKPAGNAKAKTIGAGLAALAEDDSVAQLLDVMNISVDFVLPMCIPTAHAGMSAEDRQPVEVESLGNFETFLPAPINARLDYKVLGYRTYAVPPAAAYMRPHTDAGRLRGALEEQSMRGPLGSALDGAEEPLEMPDSCLLPPSHDAMSLLVPSSECRSFVALPESTECDPEYRLSQAPALLLPLDAHSMLPRNIKTLDTPWLAAWRPVRQIADPFRHLDPSPPTFADAGGSYGPRLGCDVMGERLRCLPVGGVERDLPSDTDDDECGDFHLPPPSDSSFNAAIKNLDLPLTSDRWRKEEAAEERLREFCISNSKAVREKLVQLCHDLHPRNKVFLC